MILFLETAVGVNYFSGDLGTGRRMWRIGMSTRGLWHFISRIHRRVRLAPSYSRLRSREGDAACIVLTFVIHRLHRLHCPVPVLQHEGGSVHSSRIALLWGVAVREQHGQ